MLEHGRLRLVLLQLIAAKPAHGYELIRPSRKTGRLLPQPRRGVSHTDSAGRTRLRSVDASSGSRKLYSITATGQTHLDEHRTTLEEMSRRFDSKHHRSDLPAPILRGMENLKMALRMRLEQGEISNETARAIAATLDQATQTIEQL
jgi:DNA-binding PadR family transcriptional regulator